MQNDRAGYSCGLSFMLSAKSLRLVTLDLGSRKYGDTGAFYKFENMNVELPLQEVTERRFNVQDRYKRGLFSGWKMAIFTSL